jgi:hypothetical protein
MWDSLGFSGSLGAGATDAAAAALGSGAGVALLISVPAAFFSSSFTLLGLHTTSVTTPSVFFSREAACKIGCEELVSYSVSCYSEAEREHNAVAYRVII